MLGRRFSSFSLPFAVALVLVAAAGATTLTVVVSPQTVGTATSPKAQTVTLDLSQIGYANSRPSRTLTGVTEALPTTFKDDLAQGTSCPVADFSNVGNSPPACPSGSEVGSTSFGAYVPSINYSTTAAGYIYKVSPTQVDAWVHITKPAQVSVALVGKLTAGTRTTGPSIYWDLSAAIDFGVTADITSFDTAFNPHAVSVAVRKTITVKKKRKTVITHRTVTASTFESTGCPAAGSWNYSATLKYKSGSPETVTDAVACSPAAPTTVTVTVTNPGTCLGPICIEKTALGADATPAPGSSSRRG